jgi:hypothetical protein
MPSQCVWRFFGSLVSSSTLELVLLRPVGKTKHSCKGIVYYKDVFCKMSSFRSCSSLLAIDEFREFLGSYLYVSGGDGPSYEFGTVAGDSFSKHGGD